MNRVLKISVMMCLAIAGLFIANDTKAQVYASYESITVEVGSSNGYTFTTQGCTILSATTTVTSDVVEILSENAGGVSFAAVRIGTAVIETVFKVVYDDGSEDTITVRVTINVFQAYIEPWKMEKPDSIAILKKED